MSKVTKRDIKNIKEQKQIKNPVAIKPEDTLDPRIVQELEDKLPDYIKEYEADGTSILRWNMEYLILLEEILRRHFDFSDDDVVRMETYIKEMLPHLHEMQLKGLTILNHENMKIAMNIVALHKAQIQEKTSKLVLPKGVRKLK